MIILLIPRIKPKTLWIILLVFCCWFQAKGQEFIADYKVSKESVLRQIPVSYIEAAKNNLHIMYCGTSVLCFIASIIKISCWVTFVLVQPKLVSQSLPILSVEQKTLNSLKTCT